MTLQLNNYATEMRKIVKLEDGVLTHSPRKEGEVWTHSNVAGAFALDFLTLTHGWRKFPQKGSGLPTSYEMTPAETVWTPEEAHEMKADGWRFLIIAKVASKELGGVAEIHATEAGFITAIFDLYNEFLDHPDSTEGTVPLVTYVVDEMGNQAMTIQGFIPRPNKVFGQPCNSLPQRKPPAAAPAIPTPVRPVSGGSGAEEPITRPMNQAHQDMVAKIAAKQAAHANGHAD
jgi:hypothetical protein